MKLWQAFVSLMARLFEPSDEGEWHDPRPCRNCGMRIFYAIDQNGELRLKCAMCRKDE